MKVQFPHNFAAIIMDDGGQIVKTLKSRFHAAVLIRLPEGKFHELEDTKFEYLEFHQGPGDDFMYHAMSRNGSLREVKGRMENDFEEDFRAIIE